MRFLLPCLLAAYLVIMFPGQAQAYLDPGTGSLILQSLGAAFVAVMVCWRSLRRKLLGLFRREPPMENRPKQGGAK